MNAITENVEIDTITDDDKGVLLIRFYRKATKNSKPNTRVQQNVGACGNQPRE